jgi:SAM-dependent methyltransferase
LVVGVDIGEGDIKRAQSTASDQGIDNVEFQVANAHALPFQDRSFDAVWSSGMLEHVAPPQTALTEMHRVMKPGGLLGLRGGDFRGHMWTPSSEIDRVMELIATLFQLNGADANHGGEQPRLLRETGFEPLDISASYYGMDGRECLELCRGILLNDQNVGVLRDAGLADEEELSDLLGTCDGWARESDTIFFQAWWEVVAKKPD